MGQYVRKDYLYAKAKDSGLRSRAAYKLKELNKKYSLIARNDTVLDLGAFPGGWVQVALSLVGSCGRVCAVDLRPVDEIVCQGRSAEFYQGDILDEVFCRQLENDVGEVQVILSDMAPQLTGIHFRDTARSIELVESALLMAENILKPGGNFVAKAFPCHEADQLISELRGKFTKVCRAKLKSTRKSSTEYYIVALGYLR